jgi:hypothetical protein
MVYKITDANYTTLRGPFIEDNIPSTFQLLGECSSLGGGSCLKLLDASQQSVDLLLLVAHSVLQDDKKENSDR